MAEEEEWTENVMKKEKRFLENAENMRSDDWLDEEENKSRS